MYINNLPSGHGSSERLPNLLIVFLLASMLLVLSCNNEKKNVELSGGKSDAGKKERLTVQPASPPTNFKHAMTNVNNVNIHYVIGGAGEPLVLLHGFGQNWYMWNRLLPELSKHFTVIAPDLRGVGESGKPIGGYDKRTMATDIHELVKKLGYKNINLAGHDIG